MLFILGQLDDADLQWLLEAGAVRRVVAGTCLIREGQPLDTLFIVLEGELRVRLVAQGDREIARLGVGEIVGDMSLLDARPPTATVDAASAASVFCVPHADLRRRLAGDEGFASRFYRALCLFLANRLSRATMLVGGGGTLAPDEQLAGAEELSTDALEQLSLAGARFDWFCRQVRADEAS